MTVFRIFAIAFALLCVAVAADAGVITGGPLTAPLQTQALCTITNVSLVPVLLLIGGPTEEHPSVLLGIVGDIDAFECIFNNPLLPGRSCRLYGDLSDAELVSCAWAFVGPATLLRGALQILDSGGAVLATTNLR